MSPDIRYTTGGAVVLAFVLAAVVSSVGRAIIHRMLKALQIGGAGHREAIQAGAQQLIRALTLLAYGVAALASVTLALERLGVDEPRWNPRLLLHWTLSHGVNIVIICVGSFIVLRAANLAISHFQFTLSQRHTEADREPMAEGTCGRLDAGNANVGMHTQPAAFPSASADFFRPEDATFFENAVLRHHAVAF